MYGEIAGLYEIAVHFLRIEIVHRTGGASPSPTAIWEHLRIRVHLYRITGFRVDQGAVPNLHVILRSNATKNPVPDAANHGILRFANIRDS